MALTKRVFPIGLICVLETFGMAQQPLVPIPAQTEPEVGGIVVTLDHCALQNGQGSTYLPKGVQLRVIALSGDWIGCSVLVGGKEEKGWIKEWLVANVPNAVRSLDIKLGDMVLTLESSAMKLGEQVLADVPKGTQFDVNGISGEWVHVRGVVGGRKQEGWLEKRVLKLVYGPSANSGQPTRQAPMAEFSKPLAPWPTESNNAELLPPALNGRTDPFGPLLVAPTAAKSSVPRGSGQGERMESGNARSSPSAAKEHEWSIDSTKVDGIKRVEKGGKEQVSLPQIASAQNTGEDKHSDVSEGTGNKHDPTGQVSLAEVAVKDQDPPAGRQVLSLLAYVLIIVGAFLMSVFAFHAMRLALRRRQAPIALESFGRQPLPTTAPKPWQPAAPVSKPTPVPTSSADKEPVVLSGTAHDIEVAYFCPACRTEFALAGKCSRCNVQLQECGWCKQCAGHFCFEAGEQCPIHRTALTFKVKPSIDIRTQHIELQEACDRRSVRNSLRGAGIGSIIWGVIAVAMGVSFAHENPVNIILVYLGVGLVVEGAIVAIFPRPGGLILDGVTLILVGTWNIGTTLFVLGIMQWMWGIRSIRRYFRFSQVRMDKSTDLRISAWVDKTIKEVRSLNPMKADNVITLTTACSGANQTWKALLRPDGAVFVMVSGGHDILIAPKDAVCLTSQIPHGAKPSKTINIVLDVSGRVLKGAAKVEQLQRLNSWKWDRALPAHNTSQPTLTEQFAASV